MPSISDLGNKYECFSCGAKFYDMGRSEPICPKCGANQKDARKQELASDSIHAKRKRREEVVRVPDEDEELATPTPAADDDFPEDEIERPEGVEEEEVEEDFDDEE
ncbi:MAG: hypothetical protein AMXMBFR36_15770 [Acidobacteriota bacterium]